MQIDSRNTVETLRTILAGMPNVIVLKAEIVLSTGIKIQIGTMCPNDSAQEGVAE